MQPDLSPAEYRQEIDAELGLADPVSYTRAVQAIAAASTSMEECSAAWNRMVTGHCCEAGQVVAPGPCPWHAEG